MKGWLLDTNVVAELALSRPDANVAAWARKTPEHTMFISVLTLAEYDKGIERLPERAPERTRYRRAVDALELRFAGRVLTVGDEVARAWGRLSGRAKRETGLWPPVIDAMLAATALVHDMILVTRNVRDVRGTGVDVLDPWNQDAAG